MAVGKLELEVDIKTVKSEQLAETKDILDALKNVIKISDNLISLELKLSINAQPIIIETKYAVKENNVKK